jgi:hypothetical protein
MAENSPIAATANETAPNPLNLTSFSLDWTAFLTGWIKH